MNRFVSLALVACCVPGWANVSVAAGSALPTANPESVGFSSQRLQTLTKSMHGVVDEKRLSGMVTMVARHGKLIYTDAYGVKNLDTQEPMTLDTIFRIYFGYDVAVFESPELAGSVVGKGTYLWDGAAGTWFWVDPTLDVVYVGMIQRMGGPGRPNVEQQSRPLTYQALLEPNK